MTTPIFQETVPLIYLLLFLMFMFTGLLLMWILGDE